MRTLFMLFSVFVSVCGSAQTLVPYFLKTGKYIYVDETTMKPVSNQEFDRLPEILTTGYKIDEKGNIILPVSTTTDNLQDQSDPSIFFEVVENEDGWYGYKNKQGELVVPCIYERAESFTENRAFVKIARDEGGYIDTTGKMIIAFKGSIRGSNFSEGLARMGNWDHTFFVDREGNIKLIFADEPYDMASITKSFSPKPIDKSKIVTLKGYWLGVSEDDSFGTDDGFHEGLLGVKYEKIGGGYNKLGAFIDKSGNFIIPVKEYSFDAGYGKGFKNGYAILRTYDYRGGNCEFYIDKKGREFLEK